jgi:hypothetical protein
MNNIKQFKLSSGEEIVCEVVEWANEDEPDLVVRNSFKLLAYTNPSTSTKYYTFAPWMIFQDQQDMLQIINSVHIIAEANPSAKLLEQYFIAVNNENENEQAVKDKLDEYLAKLRALLGEQENENDSDDPNNKIITFPGRRLH